MSAQLRESYFTCNDRAIYFLDGEKKLREESIVKLLELHESNHEEFERLINEIKDSKVGLCKPGEYICVNTDAESGSKFKHIPATVFSKLIKDPDTIRLRCKMSDIILLQYNPEVVAT